MTQEKPEETQQQEKELSSTIVAFCALMARIVMRCLRERDPEVMNVLFPHWQFDEQETGERHDSAA
jgi:hypothetical protein